MRFLQNIPIKRKLTILTMLTSGVALLLACVAFVTYEQVTFRRTMAAELSVLTDLIDDNLAPGLTFNDSKSLEITLSALNANPSILAAVVYDKADKPMAMYQRADLKTRFLAPRARDTSTYFEKDRLNAFRRIVLAGENIGTIYIASDLRELTARFWRYGIIVSLVLLLSSLVAFALSAKLQHIISDPISHLASVAHAVAIDQDYSVRAIKHGKDELGRLIDGFNEMLNQIQARDGALRDARDTLEERVEDRTRSLKLEILERSAVQAALGASEEKFRQLAENITDVFWMTSPDLQQMLYISPAYEQIWDRSAASLHANPHQWIEAILPADRDRVLAVFGTLMDSAPSVGVEYRIARPDGEIRWVHDRGFQVRDGAGTLIRLTGIVSDITGRKQIEEAMQRQQTELRVLFDLMPAMVWFKDTNDRILRVNQRVADTAGKPINEIEGKPSVENYPEEAASHYMDDLEVIHSGKPKLGIVETIRDGGGGEVWIQTDKVPVCGNDGKVTGIVVMAQDITERRRADEKLRESQRLLQSTLDALSAHIAILDAAGVIIAVNAVWQNFAEANDFMGGSFGVGFNYLEVCESATGDCAVEAAAVAAGIRAVMAKQRGEFQLEYPCHSPNEQRWFMVRVTRFVGDGPVRIVVAHENITQRRRADEKLEEAHKQLLDTSRQAGMAEVATSVLHNVGNVLNSVNVSTTLVAEQLKKSKVANLAKAVALMNEHEADLGEFITNDPKGKQLPAYFTQLASHLAAEQSTLLGETDQLRKNIEHIKDIVAMQQSYARVSGVTETLKISDLVEDALRMNAGALMRHEVEVVREFEEIPPITIDKHKVLQVLVNLIRNAKYACDESGRADKRMTVRVANGEGRLKIAITDNGVGIPTENLIRIFNHGFTTRQDGHGFGLHSGALAAKEMGGALSVHSEGPGRGASFTLELPLGAVSGNADQPAPKRAEAPGIKNS